MASYTSQDRSTNGLGPVIGPHRSYIQVAQRFIFEQDLQKCMAAIGATEAKEDNIRLQGVTWIDNVRKALQLPTRTYSTACMYYHKFRLVHPDNEYDFRDAAAAALFSACKIEDTLKKSRDILCAAYNLKVAPAEHLSSDDAIFDSHSKTIVGLERLMLEASGFDFRSSYPQKLLIKLAKSSNMGKEVGLIAYNILLDLYRTFASLKQTEQTMALACFELAIRVCDIDMATVTSKHGFDYDKWWTTRPEIMETLVDLLDLYTHHRNATIIGPNYPLDTFISIRITLNQESATHNYPRYTRWVETTAATPSVNDTKKSASDSLKTSNGRIATPNSISSPSPLDTPGSVGERGKDGTVRFMLDPSRAKREKAIVNEYFRTEEVEEEVAAEFDVSNVLLARHSALSPEQVTSPSGTFPSIPYLTSGDEGMSSMEDEDPYSPPDILDTILVLKPMPFVINNLQGRMLPPPLPPRVFAPSPPMNAAFQPSPNTISLGQRPSPGAHTINSNIDLRGTHTPSSVRMANHLSTIPFGTRPISNVHADFVKQNDTSSAGRIGTTNQTGINSSVIPHVSVTMGETHAKNVERPQSNVAASAAKGMSGSEIGNAAAAEEEKRRQRKEMEVTKESGQ